MLHHLLDHLFWADERAAQALASLPSPQPALVQLYAHILGAEAVWLQRIAGRPADVAPWPVLDLVQCKALATRNRHALRELSLAPDALARPVRYTNTKGATFDNTIAEILHHIVMHGMYHRGQIMHGVRQNGGTPMPTDFIAFLREG